MDYCTLQVLSSCVIVGILIIEVCLRYAQKYVWQNLLSCLIMVTITATKLLPIERALCIDIVTVLMVYEMLLLQ